METLELCQQDNAAAREQEAEKTKTSLFSEQPEIQGDSERRERTTQIQGPEPRHRMLLLCLPTALSLPGLRGFDPREAVKMSRLSEEAEPPSSENASFASSASGKVGNNFSCPPACPKSAGDFLQHLSPWNITGSFHFLFKLIFKVQGERTAPGSASAEGQAGCQRQSIWLGASGCKHSCPVVLLSPAAARAQSHSCGGAKEDTMEFL